MATRTYKPALEVRRVFPEMGAPPNDPNMAGPRTPGVPLLYNHCMIC